MNLKQAQELIGEVVEVTVLDKHVKHIGHDLDVDDNKYVGLLWFVGRNEFLNRWQANVGYSSPSVLEIETFDQIRKVTEKELENFDIKSFVNLQSYLKSINNDKNGKIKKV